MSLRIEPTLEADFTFSHHEAFRLSAGGSLQPVSLRYSIYGELSTSCDNAVLVCHALSGSSRVGDWWPQLLGPNQLFDTNHYCVIGINVIGSCYGSTGPCSEHPKRPGQLYGSDFPIVTIRDMVRAQSLLLDHLGIERLHTVIGGSIGGMQALSWAVEFPERVNLCFAIAAAPISAMGLALNHLQRQAIRNDPAWQGGKYPREQQPRSGLALARAIAICSYKSAELFADRFGRQPDRSGEDPLTSLTARYDVAGYLDYQGSSFTNRFDANSYLLLSKAMDTFHLAEDDQSAPSIRLALSRIRARLLLVGISSDWLFPASDVRALAAAASAAGVKASYVELISSHGHDAFLADAERLAPIVKAHFQQGAAAHANAAF
jgi:homoserine O-acetyltransferase